MSDPFESPKFLLNQTWVKTQELKFLAEAMFANKRGASVVQVDPKTGNKTYKIEFDKPISGEIRHIAATAFSDLKHALDQSVCASVREITGAVPKDLYFPFATTPTDLKKRLTKFPTSICPMLESFEPYPTGQGYTGGNNLLCSLSNAAGKNKHQITLKVCGRIVEFRVDSISYHGIVGTVVIPPNWDISNNELIIGTTTPDGHIDYKFGMSFYIALFDVAKFNGTPVVPVLEQLCTRVRETVEKIEAETSRILGGTP